MKLRAPDRGVLFVVSGPSGVGKSTLVREAMARIPGLSFSVSATTRAPREGEQDGVDYWFLSEAEFQARVETGAFLEHAIVYGRSYGTLREPVEEALAARRSLILDIDVQGSRQIRRSLPEAVHVLIVPPDLTTLERRLLARGTDSLEVIARRMAEIGLQLVPDAYDYLVPNDDLDTAHALFQGVLLAEMARRERNMALARALLAPLR